MTDAESQNDQTVNWEQDREDAAFRNDLLAVWLDDVEAGRTRDIAEYLAMFPGHEDAVAEELKVLSESSTGGSSPEAGTPEIPDVELIEKIGSGGQGVVYRGRQTYVERDVAVKILSPTNWSKSFAARFQREAKTLAALRHPNIVTCFQAGTSDQGLAYLVMEFIDGPNLREWVARNGPMPEAVALRVCRDLSRALAHAQESNIIHRDIKPENVLLRRLPTGEGDPFEVKLADLGLARVATKLVGDDSKDQLTPVGAVVGSPLTMAPEQIDDPENVDFRADIYGVGCVLFHSIAGKPAFASKTLTEMIAEKVKAKTPDLRSVLPGLKAETAALVRAMLAPAPKDRPESHIAVAESCERLLGLDAARARRRGWITAVASVLVLVTLMVVDPWGIIRGPSVVIAATENVIEGQAVTLNAKGEGGSTTGLTYAWTQIGSPRVRLEGSDTAIATFTAPRGLGASEFAFEVEVSSGWRSRTEVVRVLVAADPRLKPLGAGTEFPLLNTAFGKIEEGWRKTATRGTWQGAEDHPGAAAFCKNGTTRRSRFLPRGSWLLTGAMEPLEIIRSSGPGLRIERAGVRLDFSCGKAVVLELAPKAEGQDYIAGIRRMAEGVSESERVSDYLAESQGSWSDERPLAFAIEWNGETLEFEWGTSPDAEDWTRRSIDPRTWPSAYPPSDLTIYVVNGRACFCKLSLTGR